MQASQELEESIDLAPSRGGVDDKVMTPGKRKERSEREQELLRKTNSEH